MEEFKRFIVDYITENKLQWDQVLLEHSKTLEWIHIGLFNMYGKQRMQIKHMFI
jgi:hypothetical protein